MLSICIPIYNCDVRKLVRHLCEQAEDLPADYELLLIDDYSDISYRKLNREIASLSCVRYVELPENIGRSRIRNYLAEEAKYRYLIFMDCDAEVCEPRFLANYLLQCQANVVCCGGIKTLSAISEGHCSLRQIFSLHREEVDALARNRYANENFKTFNFLIDKQIFASIGFDEELKGYGHEDTLFGIELMKHNIQILHIDNPLLHVELDDNDTFISKTEQGIRNLINIQNRASDSDLFTNSVKLLRTERKIARWHLSSFARFFLKTTKNNLLRNLKSEKPNLLCFDLYKLGYLLSLRKEKMA